MDVVNSLKAEVGNIGIHLAGERTDLIVDVAMEHGEKSDTYTAIVVSPDIGTITVQLTTDCRTMARLIVYNNGTTIELPTTGYGFNIHLDYYRVLSENGKNVFTLQGTDAFGELEWKEDGCEVIADLSDDRICPDDATDMIKMTLIALLFVQSMIGENCPAMKCKTYKKYYDSLTSR